MKAVRCLAFVTIAVFTCAAPGCPHRKWQGPSSFYRALDRIERSDGTVTKTEWAGMYGSCLRQVSTPQCSWIFAEHMAEFSCMDRDFSGDLSWSEYYDRRFVHAYECPAMIHLIRHRPEFDAKGQLLSDRFTVFTPGGIEP